MRSPAGCRGFTNRFIPGHPPGLFSFSRVSNQRPDYPRRGVRYSEPRGSKFQDHDFARLTIEAGSIDGNTSGTFTLTGSDYGTLSTSVVFASTWNAATAY